MDPKHQRVWASYDDWKCRSPDDEPEMPLHGRRCTCDDCCEARAEAADDDFNHEDE